MEKSNREKPVFSEKDKSKKNPAFRKITLLFLIAGCLGFAAFLWYIFLGPRGKEISRPRQVISEESGFVEPLIRGSGKAAADEKLGQKQKVLFRLEGIVLAGSERFAVIEGRMFSRQDKINGFRVAEISNSQVKLVNDESGESEILEISF